MISKAFRMLRLGGRYVVDETCTGETAPAESTITRVEPRWSVRK
jgi:hypothetical protein